MNCTQTQADHDEYFHPSSILADDVWRFHVWLSGDGMLSTTVGPGQVKRHFGQVIITFAPFGHHRIVNDAVVLLPPSENACWVIWLCRDVFLDIIYTLSMFVTFVQYFLTFLFMFFSRRFIMSMLPYRYKKIYCPVSCALISPWPLKIFRMSWDHTVRMLFPGGNLMSVREKFDCSVEDCSS